MFLDKRNIQWKIYTEPAEYEDFMTFGNRCPNPVLIRHAQRFITIHFVDYPHLIVQEAHYIFEADEGPNYYILVWLNNISSTVYTNWFN